MDSGIMYSILPAFVSALFLGFGLYVLATRGCTRVSIPFVLMCATTFAWQGTWAFLFQTTDAKTADLLVKTGYFFILFVPTTFYHFVTEVVSRRDEKPLVLASYGLCILLAVLLMTGNMVVDGFGRHFFGPYPKAGPLHPVHVVQTVLLASRSGWLLITARRKTRARDVRQLLAQCLVSLSLYALAATDYAVNYGVEFYPLGVISIAISLGILPISIVRGGLMGPYLLAAIVAHEVATPLAAIGLYADELRKVLPELLRGYRIAVDHRLCAGSLHPAQLERLPTLASSIRRLVDTTSMVIEMSFASFTLDHLDRHDFTAYPVRTCVETAVDRFPFRPGDRDRTSVAEIDPELQFSGSDSLVVFVLFNLLKNALYAIHANGDGRIEIDAYRDAGYCVLRFSDSGPGIAPDVLPHVFDPFYSTKSHGRGAGMGLTFCRRVCEALGGDISCESIVGVRTTFTIRLPEPGSPADRVLRDSPARARRYRVG